MSKVEMERAAEVALTRSAMGAERFDALSEKYGVDTLVDAFLRGTDAINQSEKRSKVSLWTMIKLAWKGRKLHG